MVRHRGDQVTPGVQLVAFDGGVVAKCPPLSPKVLVEYWTQTTKRLCPARAGLRLDGSPGVTVKLPGARRLISRPRHRAELRPCQREPTWPQLRPEYSTVYLKAKKSERG